MKVIHSGADDWQSVHELPTGAILIDDSGDAYQVTRHDAWPGEVAICPVSDEYAFIVRREASKHGDPKIGQYLPQGNLTLIWTPSQ